MVKKTAFIDVNIWQKNNNWDSAFKTEHLTKIKGRGKYTIRNGEMGKVLNSVFYPIFSKSLFEEGKPYYYYSTYYIYMNQEDSIQVLQKKKMIPKGYGSKSGIKGYLYDVENDYRELYGNVDSLLSKKTNIANISDCNDGESENCFHLVEPLVVPLDPEQEQSYYYSVYIPGSPDVTNWKIESPNCKKFLDSIFKNWKE